MTTTVSPHDGVRTVVGIAITIDPPVENGGALRIRLNGELDTWSAPTLTLALTGVGLPARGPGQGSGQIVLDLYELTFLDTGGLTALTDARHALLDAGWLVAAGPAQPQVCRLLRFADRSGWLVDGPLAAEQSSPSHLHVTPSKDEGRRPRSVACVRDC